MGRSQENRSLAVAARNGWCGATWVSWREEDRPFTVAAPFVVVVVVGFAEVAQVRVVGLRVGPGARVVVRVVVVRAVARVVIVGFVGIAFVRVVVVQVKSVELVRIAFVRVAPVAPLSVRVVVVRPVVAFGARVLVVAALVWVFVAVRAR